MSARTVALTVSAAGALAAAGIAASIVRAVDEDETRIRHSNPKSSIDSAPRRAINGQPLKPGQSPYGGGRFF
jgi:hypothetical protein